MILANTVDGTAHHIDLSCVEQRSFLFQLISSGKVTGLTLLYDSVHVALPKPKKFRGKYSYSADFVKSRDGNVIGESIYVYAGHVCVRLTLLYRSNFIRCDLLNSGAIRYNALARTE
jgi:hypothetical protein